MRWGRVARARVADWRSAGLHMVARSAGVRTAPLQADRIAWLWVRTCSPHSTGKRGRVKSVSNYVDGQWVNPKVERFHSVNPASGEPLASAPASDAAAVDAAVA